MGEVIQDSIEDETIAKKLDEAIEAASSVRAEMIDNLISINGNMMQTSQDLSPSDESEYVKETVQRSINVVKRHLVIINDIKRNDTLICLGIVSFYRVKSSFFAYIFFQ